MQYEFPRENRFVKHLVTILRSAKTETSAFQKATRQLGNYLALLSSHYLMDAYEENVPTETPCGTHKGTRLVTAPVLCPVLRAGLSLLPTFQAYFEGSSVAFVGIKRDEVTAEPIVYYLNFPDLTKESHVIILEPMLATGGTIMQTVEFLIRRGVPENHIVVCCVIVARAGIERIQKHHPDVTIVFAECDAKLNELKYIVPGLGDFGDRFFGNFSVPYFQELKMQQSPTTPPTGVDGDLLLGLSVKAGGSEDGDGEEVVPSAEAKS